MSRNPFAWFGVSLRRRWLDDDLEALGEQLAGRGLEIGAGRILRRGRFRPAPAEGWVSLDITARPQPHVIGDAQRLPLKTETFEAVVCSEVSEYIPELGEALGEIRRVLGPEGRLLLAAPFLHRADAPNDLRRLTEAGLRRALEEAGFTVLEVRAQGAALGVAANILRFAVMSIEGRALRLLVSALAYLPVRALAAADSATARRLPVLRSFSTGFVVLAQK